jgi:anti-sigma B factor antagonist
MNLAISEQKNMVIIAIKEERLDAHNATDLKTELLALFDQGKKVILVDLQDVRFIDSSGLGALVSGFKNAITHQGSLKLASLQPQVKSMFELTRLHRVFDIYPSPADVPEQP